MDATATAATLLVERHVGPEYDIVVPTSCWLSRSRWPADGYQGTTTGRSHDYGLLVTLTVKLPTAPAHVRTVIQQCPACGGLSTLDGRRRPATRAVAATRTLRNRPGRHRFVPKEHSSGHSGCRWATVERQDRHGHAESCPPVDGPSIAFTGQEWGTQRSPRLRVDPDPPGARGKAAAAAEHLPLEPDSSPHGRGKGLSHAREHRAPAAPTRDIGAGRRPHHVHPRCRTLRAGRGRLRARPQDPPSRRRGQAPEGRQVPLRRQRPAPLRLLGSRAVRLRACGAATAT